MKTFLLFISVFLFGRQFSYAQLADCTFKPPFYTQDFGAGENAPDANTSNLPHYDRVRTYCPSDGYYSLTPETSDCFSGDWLTLPEDHTPGDVQGNIMLVNASYSAGVFFHSTITGLKANTTYEFAVWFMNVCRISDKCPYPLLPNIIIRLRTPSGRVVAQFGTGELVRRTAPHWTRYRGIFTTQASESTLIVTMQDTAPGGCGNDFAMDDITLRECVKPTAVVVQKPAATPKKQSTPIVKKIGKKEPIKKPISATPSPVPATITPEQTTPVQQKTIIPKKTEAFAPAPAILRSRSNPLVKQIETGAGSIKIDLYDNGEIDGDTVSIYHNNKLIVSHTRLSQKPITFTITLDAAHPHHELVMVAHNLGSIPPNTSLMIVLTPDKRYEAHISSTEQKNAKVVIDLSE